MKKLLTIFFILGIMFTFVYSYELTNHEISTVSKITKTINEKIQKNGENYREKILNILSKVQQKLENDHSKTILGLIIEKLELGDIIENQTNNNQNHKPIVETGINELEIDKNNDFAVDIPKYHHNILGGENERIGSFEIGLGHQPVTVKKVQIEFLGSGYEDSIQTIVLYGENGQEITRFSPKGDQNIDMNYLVYDGYHIFVKAITKEIGKSSFGLSQGKAITNGSLKLKIIEATDGHKIPSNFIHNNTNWLPNFDILPVDVKNILLTNKHDGLPEINKVLNGQNQVVGYLIVETKNSSNNRNSQNKNADMVLRKINIQGNNVSDLSIERVDGNESKINILTNNLNTNFENSDSAIAKDLTLDTKYGEIAIFKIYGTVVSTNGVSISLDTVNDFQFSTDENINGTFVGELFSARIPNRNLSYTISSQ